MCEGWQHAFPFARPHLAPIRFENLLTQPHGHSGLRHDGPHVQGQNASASFEVELVELAVLLGKALHLPRGHIRFSCFSASLGSWLQECLASSAPQGGLCERWINVPGSITTIHPFTM